MPYPGPHLFGDYYYYSAGNLAPSKSLWDSMMMASSYFEWNTIVNFSHVKCFVLKDNNYLLDFFRLSFSFWFNSPSTSNGSFHNKIWFICKFLIKVGDCSRGWPEGSFQYLLHRYVGEVATPFSGSLHFSLVPYVIMLRAQLGGIKYHFLSLWYDSTRDWTPVSRTIGEHSTY